MDQPIIYILLGFLVWLIVLSYYSYRSSQHYQKLVQGSDRQNLSQILDKIIDDLKKNNQNIEELEKELNHLSQKSVLYIQKVGLLRFNPFSDTGGDQSFILTILDNQDTGIVLTSLHSRGITRWYAKKVKQGVGVDHELSEEEKLAIKKTIIIKNKKDLQV